MDVYEKLRLQSIPRWTMVNTSREQNVAEHTLNVITLSLEIARRLNMMYRYDEIMWIAYNHDMMEIKTGDVPSPTKLRLGDVWDRMEVQLDSDAYKASKGGAPEVRAQGSTDGSIYSRFGIGRWFLELYACGSHAKQVARWLDDKFNAAIIKYMKELPAHRWSEVSKLMSEVVAKA